MHVQSAPVSGIVIPLTKIDVERRLVIGVAAEEKPDRTNEIMDYDSAKQAFQAWSNAAYERSNGLSKGNLRAMHDPKSASGVFEQISFDDDNKLVEVCAKVVDDNDWKKCLAGVYTGFSIGGGYAKKWDDPMMKGVKRYTPRIAEISLVDSPCMPGARFAELVKADGLVEQLELVGRPDEPETFGALWKRYEHAPTFASFWNSRPMTFGDLMKADQNHDQKGRFSSANYGHASTAAGVGGAVGGIAGYALSHINNTANRKVRLAATAGGALGGSAIGYLSNLTSQSKDKGAIHPHSSALHAAVGGLIRHGTPEEHAAAYHNAMSEMHVANSKVNHHALRANLSQIFGNKRDLEQHKALVTGYGHEASEAKARADYHKQFM